MTYGLGVNIYWTIYYFDNFLVPSNDYRLQIDANLLEDKERFYPFIGEEFIKIDIFIAIFIFIFLVRLDKSYCSKIQIRPTNETRVENISTIFINLLSFNS